jgi:hypothetical protein
VHVYVGGSHAVDSEYDVIEESKRIDDTVDRVEFDVPCDFTDQQKKFITDAIVGRWPEGLSSPDDVKDYADYDTDDVACGEYRYGTYVTIYEVIAQ